MANDNQNEEVPPVLWTPPSSNDSQVDQFRRLINMKYHLSLKNYWELHEWSIKHYPEFWKELWDFLKIICSKPFGKVVDTTTKFEDVPDWFIGARLNYTENVLRYEDDLVAFYVSGETRPVGKVTYGETRRLVAEYAAALKKAGVRTGDLVVGYITNSLPAACAFLAGASIGAVWSAVSLEFGIAGVLDRLTQIQPKVMFTVDHAVREGKGTNYLEKLPLILKELPSIKKVVICPSREDLSPHDIAGVPHSCLLSEFLASGRNGDGSAPSLEFAQLPANHPVIISYTSGTTGPPKGLVHSSSALLLQMMKEWSLHADLSKGDSIAVFTTVGWAAWNMTLTVLACGVSFVLYDGSPLYPNTTHLWDVAEEIGISCLFLFPYMLDRCEKDGVKPRYSHNLPKLRSIVMGASCPKPQNWNYIRNYVKPGVFLCSGLGATDTMSALAAFNYALPIHLGEIQAPSLGMAVECYNEEGKPVIGEVGELVVTAPFPSMPLTLWGDPKKEKYKKTYFQKIPGVWVQGDLCRINPVTRGIVMLGRSDAVLNPKGRRFGSSEIYNVVEKFKEVFDSVCVGQFNENGDERAVLFLKMVPGHPFSEDLVRRVKHEISTNLTAKHCPDVVLEVKDIPYTATGKKMEVAVKNVINGRDVPGKGTIANPGSLDLYYNIPELRGF